MTTIYPIEELPYVDVIECMSHHITNVAFVDFDRPHSKLYNPHYVKHIIVPYYLNILKFMKTAWNHISRHN